VRGSSRRFESISKWMSVQLRVARSVCATSTFAAYLVQVN